MSEVMERDDLLQEKSMPETVPANHVAALKKKRRRRARRIVALLLAAAVGTGAFFYFRKDGGEQQQVITDTVYYGSITATVESNGLTKAKNSETLTMSTAGTVLEVLVSEGQQVTAGTPLFT